MGFTICLIHAKNNELEKTNDANTKRLFFCDIDHTLTHSWNPRFVSLKLLITAVLKKHGFFSFALADYALKRSFTTILHLI